MANNDYRLGNLVILHGKTCQITGILKGYFNVNDECYEDDKGEFQPVWYGNGGVEPILLTPELLEQCGIFGPTVKGDTEFYFNGDNIMIRRSDFAFFIHDEFDGTMFHFKTINYLHELQNIYHCLEGLELDVLIPLPA